MRILGLHVGPAPALLAAGVAFLSSACGADPAAAPDPSVPVIDVAPTQLPPLASGEMAIVGAHVVPMTSNEVLNDQTILIRDGIIVDIGARETVEVPAGAMVISGDSLWAAPALMDMHVHARAQEMARYRNSGITVVRNMWGTAGVAGLRAELQTGAEHAAIFSATPGLDGSPPFWPGTIVLSDPVAARQEVRRLAAAGWDFIKVYNRLRPDVYEAILAEARAAGIAVVGHVPLASDITTASAGGQASIEHLTGIAEAVAGGRSPTGWLEMDSASMNRVAIMLAEHQVYVCPTLVVLRHLANANLSAEAAIRARSNQAAAVKALHAAGVPLLAGTDAGLDLVPAGSSLAAELELFVEAGLSPYEALRTATTEAARFLGILDVHGTIEVGKRADLILLAGNPLEDIAAVRSPVRVIQRGRAY